MEKAGIKASEETKLLSVAAGLRSALSTYNDVSYKSVDVAPIKSFLSNPQGAMVHWPVNSNARTREKAKEISKSRIPNFPNFLGLVLGCIEAKFCKQVLVGKLSSRSTQCTPLHSFPVCSFKSSV